MQMILNELSARFPVGTMEKGRQLMNHFLATCFEVKEIIHNDSILLDQDYRSFELAPEYRIEQWRNDSAVDVESKRRFRTLLNNGISERSFSIRNMFPRDVFWHMRLTVWRSVF